MVGAPFSATTSEWTKLKGYNGATMPTWKPDAVTTSDQYPLCVRGSYTTDSSGVVSNGTVPNGQGDYIYALGNALNSLLTKESDFAARFGGVYAYGYNDGLEADSVICQSSPCGCAINTPVASKCDQTTKVPIVFMTENDAGNVNRIAQSSWDAWKAVEAQLPPAPESNRHCEEWKHSRKPAPTPRKRGRCLLLYFSGDAKPHSEMFDPKSKEVNNVPVCAFASPFQNAGAEK